MDDKYVRVNELAARLGVGVSTVWRWAAEGTIPQPKKIGRNVTVWRWRDVQAALGLLDNEAA